MKRLRLDSGARAELLHETKYYEATRPGTGRKFREAVDAARDNLAARGLENARVVEADAEGYAWSKAAKLVVLDPPRTGARAVAERLVASRVAHVVYVSCDAQTLGRDLAILEQGYAATSVAAFEMFPQTSHVEVVVALEKRRS